MDLGQFAVFDIVFGPVLALNPVISLTIFSAIVVFIITIFNKLLIDQKKMKEIKDRQQELQKQAKKYQKSEPEKSQKILNEALSFSNKMMKMNFRSMIPSMLFVIVFLPWVVLNFTGPVVMLPFSLPYFGNDFGWLMWYMITSIPFSITFRKIMGVV